MGVVHAAINTKNSIYTWWTLVKDLASPPPSRLACSHLKGSPFASALGHRISSNIFALVVWAANTVLAGMP